MTSPEHAEIPRVTVLLSNVLERVSLEGSGDEAGEDTISLAGLIHALEERAFGLGILILALPCCIPFLYGIPQVVALPMLALAAQLAAGRNEPWLPQSLAKREVPVGGLQDVVGRTRRYLGFLEKLASPRLQFLSSGVGARIVGAVMLIPTASILVPLPSTNTVPGIGVAIASVGLLERDGLLIIAGLGLGLVWVAALVIFGSEVASIIIDMIRGSGAEATT
ncbi:MAG: exopolysaccharide biosynthesis protein [Pseudomonadota bacterium]